jgi:hypothetical protein
VNDKIPRQNEANRRAPISSLNSSQPRFEGAVGPESPSHGLAGPTTDYEEAIEEVHLQHSELWLNLFPHLLMVSVGAPRIAPLSRASRDPPDWHNSAMAARKSGWQVCINRAR